MIAKPHVMIVRAPGTNCELETGFAFEMSGGKTTSVHLNALLESPRQLENYQVVCFPGGFSYGDDISAGHVAAMRLKRFMPDELGEFVQRGGLILGICNGFQILMKTGLLFAADESGPPATLTWNTNGRYTALWVSLQVAANRSPFLMGIERIDLPIAHAEGRFVARDESALGALDDRGQLVLRYVATADFPIGNPNGSMGDVAGICDATGRVFGLMPHPERCLDTTHHPRWTRKDRSSSCGGKSLFDNAIKFFA